MSSKSKLTVRCVPRAAAVPLTRAAWLEMAGKVYDTAIGTPVDSGDLPIGAVIAFNMSNYAYITLRGAWSLVRRGMGTGNPLVLWVPILIPSVHPPAANDRWPGTGGLYPPVPPRDRDSLHVSS